MTSFAQPPRAWADTFQPLQTVTAAQRPDLLAGLPAILAQRWPAYLLDGEPGHGVKLEDLLTAAPRHQVLLIDRDDTVLGVGLSVPLRWDRTVDGLPAGWDGAVSAAAGLLERGEEPDTVCALSITMTPVATGRGLAERMIAAVKTAAADAGIGAMIAPVRPVLKQHYPLIPMAQYLTWRTDQGLPFDPWVRLHLRLGGVQAGVAYPSVTIRGSVAQWQEWTDLSLPGPGEHLIPGGLVPLTVDRLTQRATYREPHAWFVHRTTA